MPDEHEEYELIAGSAALLLLGTGIGVGLGFLVRVIPARLLGPETYGSLILPLSAASALALISRLGLHIGISRHLPRTRNKKERRGIVATAFGFILLSSILISIGLFVSAGTVAAWLSTQSAKPLFRAFALAIPAIALRGAVISFFRGMEQTIERVLIDNILKHGVVLICVVAAIMLGANRIGVSIVWVGGIWATTLVSLLLLTNTSVVSRGPLKANPRSLLWFSLPLMLSATKGIVLEYGDLLILGIFVTDDIVGTYDAAYTVAKLMIAVFGAFGYLFMPIFSGLDAQEEHERMSRFYKVVSKWVVSLAFPLFLLFVLYPAEVQTLLFGKSYASGAVPLMILATGLFIHVGAGVARDSLVSLGHTRTIVAVNFLSVVFNLILNVVLIREFGAVGAATATAFTFVSFNVLFVYLLHRRVGIHPLSRQLVLPAMATAVIALGLNQFISTVQPLLVPLIGFGFAVIQVLAYIQFGVEEEDIHLLHRVEDRSEINIGPLIGYLRRLR